MSVFSGPEISNNGLIMLADAYNFKSYNYNLLYNSDNMSSNWWFATGTYTVNGGVGPTGKNDALKITATNNDPYMGQMITVTAGKTYNASIWIKGEGTGIGKIFFISMYDGTAWVTNSFVSLGGVPSGWTRFSQTFTPANSGTPANGAQIRFETPESAVAGDVVYAWGGQLSEGSALMPYSSTVTPTPSTWLDISGNGNHLTMVNTPYYNSGNMQFNATNQYAYNTLNLSTGTSTIIAAGRYTGASNRNRIVSSYSTNWLMGHWGSTVDNYYANGWVSAVGASPSDTNWRIYAATNDTVSDSYSLYSNGVLKVSNNGGGTGPNGIQINGYQGLSELSSCECPLIMAFNRVLSETEIQQIFNAYRGRFGI